jgi:lactate dehydrogenase-like 2-hydroxyacid dehydrogenase
MKVAVFSTKAYDRVTVVRVPAYSPHAVAEHTVGLILALNRKIYRAYARVREGNFSLDGLLGFDLRHRTRGLSTQMIQVDVFSRLLTFPNVIITGHQAFFTAEALQNIAETTLANITAFERGQGTMRQVSVEKLA